jgi:glycopeptide antibiotics resistance protein
MPDFLKYVLYELKNSLGLVVLAGIMAFAVLILAYFIHKRKYKGEKKFPWARSFLWLVFLGYLVIVVYATMLRWSGFFHREWNLHLFRAWREAWNNFSAKNWANVLLNVAMFGPLGFLLPLLGKRFRKWYVTLPAGFGVSLVIELLQLAMGRGICDVDDLFCNTLGAAIGYFII